MAFGNKANDYAHVSKGRTGFYACHAPAYSGKIDDQKPEEGEKPKRKEILGVTQTEIADTVKDET